MSEFNLGSGFDEDDFGDEYSDFSIASDDEEFRLGIYYDSLLDMVVAGDINDVRDLISEKNLDVNKIINGVSILYVAISENMEDVVTMLLNEYPNIDINFIDEEGDSLLMSAARNASFKIFSIILNKFPNNYKLKKTYE